MCRSGHAYMDPSKLKDASHNSSYFTKSSCLIIFQRKTSLRNATHIIITAHPVITVSRAQSLTAMSAVLQKELLDSMTVRFVNIRNLWLFF